MSQIIKCKMCGGSIEATADMTVGKCRYCGSLMTLPRIESEKKARLFNRANDYRLNNEFDKAYDAYKTITEEDEQESEAYWGMILSEYGVEYVEDPQSHKRIPTCHRTQVQSILDNTNYKLALKNSFGERKLLYQEEAEVLDKLQRQIFSVSSKLDPYDVFICYKETDDFTGERTKDSVLAQNIYDELEKQGIRAFFSRISLEEHLGENYEPYIYAALKSARVMLMVSTSAEHCDAVWVKNEWARFLRFLEEDDSKVLIPVYQDMDAYEFPNALSKYQAQDMGKVGAIQDLVRGVKKILGTTRTESRDAVISELVADKQERENKQRKIKRWLAIFAAAFLLVVIGINIARKVLANNREREIENKLQIVASELSGRWLSSGNVFDITLNKDGTCMVNDVALLWTRETIDEGYITILAEGASPDSYLYRGSIEKRTIVLDPSKGRNVQEAGLPTIARKRELYRQSPIKAIKMSVEGKETEQITIGSYEQDNDPKNGPEPIEWIVLEKKDNKALLISKYVLDCRQFNSSDSQDVIWATCSLREWLNHDFYNNTFSEEEKEYVMSTGYSSGSSPVQDRIFVLDFSDAIKYFKQNSDRVCLPTEYAISNGVQVSEQSGSGASWWLRRTMSASDAKMNYAKTVNGDGMFTQGGIIVTNSQQGIRPALWFRTDGLVVESISETNEDIQE